MQDVSHTSRESGGPDSCRNKNRIYLYSGLNHDSFYTNTISFRDKSIIITVIKLVRQFFF